MSPQAGTVSAPRYTLMSGCMHPPQTSAPTLSRKGVDHSIPETAKNQKIRVESKPSLPTAWGLSALSPRGISTATTGALWESDST